VYPESFTHVGIHCECVATLLGHICSLFALENTAYCANARNTNNI